MNTHTLKGNSDWGETKEGEKEKKGRKNRIDYVQVSIKTIRAPRVSGEETWVGG